MPRITISKPSFILSLVALLSAALIGCQSSRVPNPMSADLLSGQSDNDQLNFWHELAQRPLVNNDEAFHAILLFTDGVDTSSNFDARVQTLKNRNMLPKSFNAQADQAITRGDLAVALTTALNIKGGIMLRITGKNGRYADRELEYQGIYPSGNDYQTFSGQQFVGVIAKAEDLQRSRLGEPQPGDNTPPQTTPTGS